MPWSVAMTYETSSDSRVTLIGRYASPYVRRVALCMQFQRIAYDIVITSPLTEPDRVASYNPIGRVPVLVLPDGQRLIESSAIIDYLQDLVPPERRIIPQPGQARVAVLQATAIMTNAIEKAIYATYESSRRPPEKQHEPYRSSLLAQVSSALTMLETEIEQSWSVGQHVTLADITVAVGWRFLRFAVPAVAEPDLFPGLVRHSSLCEVTSEFQACQPETYNDRPSQN